MKVSNKILEAINVGLNKALISFDDNSDVEFNKSSLKLPKMSKYYDLQSCKVGDKVYLTETGNFVILDEDCEDENNIGYCVATADLFDFYDGLPRFVVNEKLYKQEPDFIFSFIDIKHIPNIKTTKDLDEAGDDYKGWENTLEMIKYNSIIAGKVKHKNFHFYIPAAGELLMAKESNESSKYLNPSDDLLTSTLFDANSMWYDDVNGWGLCDINKGNRINVQPFIHIEKDIEVIIN